MQTRDYRVFRGLSPSITRGGNVSVQAGAAEAANSGLQQNDGLDAFQCCGFLLAGA